MDFFIDQCRNSQHSFADSNEESEHLIYNYEPKFTGVQGSAFEQCYFFEPQFSSEPSKFEVILATVHD